MSNCVAAPITEIRFGLPNSYVVTIPILVVSCVKSQVCRGSDLEYNIGIWETVILAIAFTFFP